MLGKNENQGQYSKMIDYLSWVMNQKYIFAKGNAKKKSRPCEQTLWPCPSTDFLQEATSELNSFGIHVFLRADLCGLVWRSCT